MATRTFRVGLLVAILAGTSGCVGDDPPWGRATDAARQQARDMAGVLTKVTAAGRPSTTWQLAFDLRSTVTYTPGMRYHGEFVDAARGVTVGAVLDYTESSRGGMFNVDADVRLCLLYHGQVGGDEVTVVGVPCTGDAVVAPARGGGREITLDG